MTTVVRRIDARWERLGDQVVVLDRVRSNAHSLDGLVAVMWELIDGQRTGVELAAAATSTCHRDVTFDEVSVALDALRRVGLLEGQGLDRRRLLKLGAGAAVGGAALITIGLPTPAAALSVGPPAAEFLNTAGYDLNSPLGAGDGSTTPVIQSLELLFSGSTTPDTGYITPYPNVNDVVPITWSDPTIAGIALFDIIDFLDEPDRSEFMAATKMRVWFYTGATFLGQAYYPDPTT